MNKSTKVLNKASKGSAARFSWARQKSKGEGVASLVKWANGAEIPDEDREEEVVAAAIADLSDWLQARRLGGKDPLFPKPAEQEKGKSAFDRFASAIMVRGRRR